MTENEDRTPGEGKESSPIDNNEKVRLFCEEFPDGIVDEIPKLMAFCPRLGFKRISADHETCPYCDHSEIDDSGEVTAIFCKFKGETEGK